MHFVVRIYNDTNFAKTIAFFAYEWHSVSDKREIIIGHDSNYRLLLVCFTGKNHKIRIISSRLATKKERQNYEEYTKF